MKLNKDYFTANGSWTAPSGVTEVLLIGSGGGGGGSESGGNIDAGSGGGGSIQKVSYVTVTPNTSYTVTIGAGGAGGNPGSSGNGGDGGTTSFGTIFYALGGGGAPFFISGSNWPGGTNFPGAGTTSANANIGAGYGGIGGGNLIASGGPTIGYKNWLETGNFFGGALGTNNTGKGGAGGGAGPQGSGAKGGAGAIGSPATGSTPAAAGANTGAGGGGAGGSTGSSGLNATGGAGGTGYLYVIWVD